MGVLITSIKNRFSYGDINYIRNAGSQLTAVNVLGNSTVNFVVCNRASTLNENRVHLHTVAGSDGHGARFHFNPGKSNR